jgi:hypothetical protein
MNAISPSSSIALSNAQASAVAAIDNSAQSLSDDAQQIANPDGGEPVAALLDLSQSLVAAEAGAAVLRTVDKVLGSLLDVMA